MESRQSVPENRSHEDDRLQPCNILQKHREHARLPIKAPLPSALATHQSSLQKQYSTNYQKAMAAQNSEGNSTQPMFAT